MNLMSAISTMLRFPSAMLAWPRDPFSECDAFSSSPGSVRSFSCPPPPHKPRRAARRRPRPQGLSARSPS
eukprot:3937310-Rhodomonas_salina.2